MRDLPSVSRDAVLLGRRRRVREKRVREEGKALKLKALKLKALGRKFWSGVMKRVVSIWIPDWPIVRIARARRGCVPHSQPFALIVSGVHGLTISAVNTTARLEGVAIGTSLADVRAALPSLVTQPAEPDADRIALVRLARWAGRYGVNRHVDGEDGLWIDITGVAHLYGGEEKLLDDVIGRLESFGVPARAGLADTLGAAHALARFGCLEGARWAIACQNSTREAIAALPIEALRLDSPRVLLLKRLGLRRIGQLYDIPRDSLARRFRSKDLAAAVLRRLDQALGEAAEPCRPMQPLPVFSVFRVFTEPLISAEPLEAIAAELCGELAGTLKMKAMGAKAVRLALYRSDGTCAEVDAAMSEPSFEGAHILSLLREKLAGVDAGFGIDMLRLDATRVEGARVQQNTFAAAGGEMRGGADALIDRLSNRFGAASVAILRASASHVPERAEVRRPALAEVSLQKNLRKEVARDNAQRGDANYEPPWPYGSYKKGFNYKAALRPPLLLKRPEPIDVVAEVPSGPPARFTWRRVERRVARARGPERIAPEWWRHVAMPDGGKRPRTRDYYTIEDRHGSAYWVFRHGLYSDSDDDGCLPRWFLHGLFA